MRSPFLITALSMQLACRSEKVITAVNSAPVAIITSHSEGVTLLEGVEEVLFGQVTDSNHSADMLEVAWFYGNTEICPWDTPDIAGGTVCTVLPNLDSNTIRLEVRDPEGAGGVSTISVDVRRTEEPVATIESPIANGIYAVDQKITFIGHISDAEDDIDELDFEWHSDIDGTLQSEVQVSSDGTITTASYLSESQHLITLTVTDTTGKSDIASVSITVEEANTAPSCAITAPDPNSVFTENATVTLQATLFDEETALNQLAVRWVSDKDGLLGELPANASGVASLSTSNLSINTHSITLEVTDASGALCNDSIQVKIGTPPSINILSPSNGSTFIEAATIAFEVQVEDQQDAANNIALEWSLDGQPYTTHGASSSGTAYFTDSSIEFGPHTVSIVATDTDGLTDSAQVSFTINGKPSTPVIAISPNPASSLDDLSINVLQPSIDPEGQPISYTYQWLKNGIPVSGQTSDTLSASLTAKNQTWSVQVTPTDGTVQGPFATDSVTIQNIAPSISIVEIQSTGSVYNNSLLTCVATVIDPDDTLTPSYTWSVNGQSSTGNMINLANYSTSAGHTVTCTATANDGVAASVSQSTSVTIENRAPTLSNVSVSPTLLYSNSTASCTFQAQDPDGSSPNTSISWFANGNLIGSGTQLTLTGLASPTNAITCSVTASDTFDSITETSTSVLVQNTLPTAPSVSISSSNSSGNPAAEQHNLYCTISNDSTDIDGDNLSYNFLWSGPNGESIQHTGMSGPVDTLLASTPTTEGLWICSARAYDGTGLSSASTASIYVETGCPPEGTGEDATCPSSDCRSILEDGHATIGDDGLYWINPDGNSAYQAYCDMTTDGGGWTMCYTENGNMVHLLTESNHTGTYGQAGYRTDCSEIPFTDVLYVNHSNGQKAWFFAQSNSPMTLNNLGYNAAGNAAGTLFSAGGVASTGWNYQINVCDSGWMWVGIMMTGFTNCYKQCGSWCGDTSSPYFRTDGDNGGSYNGVSFNENGHRNVTYKTMSVGVR